MNRTTYVKPPQIMGSGAKILKISREIKKIAPQDRPVLISGERGTYKELLAKTIHWSSPRSDGPFIIVNMADIPGELAEADIFGLDKRAASGSRRTSKMEEAHGGTLLVDEIADADMTLQKRLRDFLLGRAGSGPGNGPVQAGDVRVIVTTTKDLKAEMEKGSFDRGLYEIFCDCHIKTPPLRERREDILPLAQNLLNDAIKKFETGPKNFSRDARGFLLKYEWPGNIRELEDIVKRAAILSQGPVIRKRDFLRDDIGSYSIQEFLQEKLKRYLNEMAKLGNCNLHATVMSEVEKSLINIVMQETGGNQLKAAKTLGINRNTLRSKIKEYKIRI
ncbi:MAG: sigma 54-interacting transcriptional regulator [Nitrospirota bacterium]